MFLASNVEMSSLTPLLARKLQGRAREEEEDDTGREEEQRWRMRDGSEGGLIEGGQWREAQR